MSPDRLGTPATGGASGIGAGICAALAEVGRPVGVWDRDADGAARVAAQCRDAHGVAAHPVGVDVTDDTALAASVETVPLPLNEPWGEMIASAIGRPEAAVSRDLSKAQIAAGWNANSHAGYRGHGCPVRPDDERSGGADLTAAGYS